MRQSRRQQTAGTAQHQLLHNTIRESLNMEEQMNAEAGAEWGAGHRIVPELPRSHPVRAKQ